jgi:tRNA-specific 2-thiouridylase
MGENQVAIALSGGVDSAVAAILLKSSGYEVIGLHMHLSGSGPQLEQKDIKNDSEKTIDQLQLLCSLIDIPFYVIELHEEFERHVIDYFCAEYNVGRTPNPCVVCNHRIKFGYLFQKAESMGAHYMATGHYARVNYHDGAYRLYKGIDKNKDQSYMLYRLDQNKLEKIIFPLGTYTKDQVRSLARQKKLPVADNPSSQDICFISGEYGEFLNQKDRSIPGDIVDSDGKVIGRHKGIIYYTVGQRHGLGIAAAEPVYIIDIQAETNRVVIGKEKELYRRELDAKDITWVSGNSPIRPIAVTVKVRYRAIEANATIYPQTDSARVLFNQPQRAVAPGQSAVFYHDDEVIGGGIIEHSA